MALDVGSCLALFLCTVSSNIISKLLAHPVFQPCVPSHYLFQGVLHPVHFKLSWALLSPRWYFRTLSLENLLSTNILSFILSFVLLLWSLIFGYLGVLWLPLGFPICLTCCGLQGVMWLSSHQQLGFLILWTGCITCQLLSMVQSYLCNFSVFLLLLVALCWREIG